MKVMVNIEIFQEEDLYIALAPELNVSSFGETPEEAQESIKEALEAFIEECEQMGTLEEVLDESGFVKLKDSYEVRKPIAEAALAFAV